MVVEGEPYGSVTLIHDVTAGEIVRGTADLTAAGSPIGAVEAGAGFELANGVLDLHEIEAQALGATLAGAIRYRLDPGLAAGEITLDAPDLAPLSRLAGAPVDRYKIGAYMISGAFAAIGGAAPAARVGRGDVGSGNSLLLDSVAAALIGYAVLGAARPNAFGTTVGALFVGTLLNGLTMLNAPYYTQDFVKGAVLVLALMFTFGLKRRLAR